MKASEEILLKLGEYLHENPEIRFCQALHNLGINELLRDYNQIPTKLRDNFYDDDVHVLNRVKYILGETNGDIHTK